MQCASNNEAIEWNARDLQIAIHVQSVNAIVSMSYLPPVLIKLQKKLVHTVWKTQRNALYSRNNLYRQLLSWYGMKLREADIDATAQYWHQRPMRQMATQLTILRAATQSLLFLNSYIQHQQYWLDQFVQHVTSETQHWWQANGSG